MFFRVIFILMSLFLLSACDDSEKEARTMLNQALQDWGEGDIKKAELKFNMIEAKYLSTEAATESISKRALLKEKYKNENNVEKARRINRGLFSRKVFWVSRSIIRKIAITRRVLKKLILMMTMNIWLYASIKKHLLNMVTS